MKDEIQVWRTNLDVAEPRLEVLAASLSEDERDRAGRFHFERDRKRWVAARGLLRAALGRLLEMSPERILFEIGPFGKPSLNKIFLKAHPLRFNVSHSNDLMLMAFAWNREVGVDVEAWRDDFSPLELAPQVFSMSEQCHLRAAPPAERHQAFLTLWTGKEAYVKAHGEGLSFPLARLTLIPPSGGGPWLVQDETAWTERPALRVYTLTAGQSYLAALAVEPAGQTAQTETVIRESRFEFSS